MTPIAPQPPNADSTVLAASAASGVQRRWKPIVTILYFLLAAILLLTRLGHNALWDDESYTALLAEGICHTGDTSIVLGHNLLAFDHGWNVTNLHDRFFPPLPFYLTAASLKLLGNTAFAARLPFVLCGLATFALIIAWLWKDRADGWTWTLLLMPLLMNVCLVLYFRQCRYYGVIIFMTVLLAYLYLHWPEQRGRQWLMLIPITALLASNYMSFFAAAACLLVDWIFWTRRTIRPSWNLAILIAAQLLIAIALLSIWNPLGAKPPVWSAVTSTFTGKLEHLWWNVRDMSVNEFFIAPLLLAAPIVAWVKRDAWLARGSVAVVVYFAVVSYLAPRGDGGFAEVRYFCPMIPLFVVLETRVLRLITPRRPMVALILAAFLFGTNLLSGATFFNSGVVPVPPRSSIAAFIGQLFDPPTECYSSTSNWLNANISPSQSVLVLPQIATYPLMFHSPQMVYAWQLPDPPPKQFEGFDSIQYEGRIDPNYIVIFGRPGWKNFRMLHPQSAYIMKETIPEYGVDLYKPELFLHVFDLKPPLNPDLDNVYVMQRAEQTP